MHDPLQRGFCGWVEVVAPVFFVLSDPDEPIHFYTASQTGEFALPAISFEMKESEPIHAGTTISQGTLTVWLENQVNDTEEDLHNARLAALLAILSDRADAVAWINALDNGVHIYGYTVEAVTNEVNEKAWTASVALNVGFVVATGV